MTSQEFDSLSPASCRAARELLKISQGELALQANISVSTVRRFETGNHTISDYAVRQIAEALQREGIMFVAAAKAIGTAE